MNGSFRFLLFTVDSQRYGLPLAEVERVVRAVEITVLPDVPPAVLGAIEVDGTVIPVLSVRRRVNAPDRPILLSDQFILAQVSGKKIALAVDAVEAVAERPAGEIVAAERIVPGLEFIHGIVRLPEGLVLIQDLGRFLSLPEMKRLDEALATASAS